MSYRVTINGQQLFGNNESYPAWDQFLKQRGIQINEEGCYDGQITDFMGAMETLESIVLELDADRKKMMQELLRSAYAKCNPEQIAATEEKLRRQYGSLFNLTDVRKKVLTKHDDPLQNDYLFDELYNLLQYGYLFLPLRLYQICKTDLESYIDPDSSRMRNYRLKKGRTIKVHAS